MPLEVRREMGFALHAAQIGGQSGKAKILRGFGGASVLEVRDNWDGDTYRVVYTVQFAQAIYVLHCFQKKSHQGDTTDQQDMELIRARLRLAQDNYRENYEAK